MPRLNTSPALYKSLTLWSVLILLAGVPRIVGAFVLPNSFGDAYAYIENIKGMSLKISDGTFSVRDLYGFWLPLYQFICAVLSAIVGSPFYVAKLVSAICGAGVCVLVFLLARRLTGNLIVSLCAFALVAVNPPHILYSVSALTDLPHAFFVLGSLYFALTGRWVLAACFAACGGLMRVESWMLIVLLPALQFIKQRRVSPVACAVLLLAPALWLYICWHATGNPFAYFEARNLYIRETVAANPKLAIFSRARVVADGRTLLDAATPVIMWGSLVGASIVFWRALGSRLSDVPESLFAIVCACAYFFAFLGFLVTGYFSGNQPDMWHRYGLIIFALGTPVVAWTFQAIREWQFEQPSLKRWHPRLTFALALLLVALCVRHADFQFDDARGALRRMNTQRAAGEFLAGKYRERPDFRIFCDEGNVREFSGIRKEAFLDSTKSPSEVEPFVRYLKERNVKYLVYLNVENSIPVKLFPELANGTDTSYFRLAAHLSNKHWDTDIWIYELRSFD